MANYLPSNYQPNWGYSGIGQQVYPQYQQQSMGMQPTGQQTTPQSPGLIWVDGEVGAKAYQMPQGWPNGQPIALWDTNDTVIYLKSTNPMGMPNPLQKARYTLEEQRGASRMSGENKAEDLTQYVRKDEMEQMKQELMEAISSMGTSTGTSRRNVKGE